MANTTYFLDSAAVNPSLSHTKCVFGKKVDFSKENVLNGGTLDVLKLPKGFVATHAGFINITDQATVTFAMALVAPATALLAATDFGAASSSAGQAQYTITAGTAAANLVTADAGTTLRVTVGGANATTAVAYFFVEGFMVDELSLS